MSVQTQTHNPDFKPEEKRVIFASSLGTVFEWYDFYLYATLAPFFAALFFPKGNDTAALLSAFATYAAGFLVRPFGAVILGRLGDATSWIQTTATLGFFMSLVVIYITRSNMTTAGFADWGWRIPFIVSA